MNCGATLPDGASLCTQCGASVYSVGGDNTCGGSQTNAHNCPACGYSYREGSKFCDNCGQKLPEPEVAATSALPPPSHSAYPPQNVPPYWANNGANPFFQQNGPVINTSTFVKWMLLMMVPVVGFIFAIIYAIDNKDKTRSNYFKAVLILQVVGAVIGFFFARIIFGLLGFVFAEDFSGLENDLYEWGDYLRMVFMSL
jgi:hypothetical protein